MDGAAGNTPLKAAYLNAIESGIIALSTDHIRHLTSADHDARYPALVGGKVPNTNLNMGSGNGLDADTVDAHQAGTAAGNILVLDGSAKVPAANLPSGGGSGFDADTVDTKHAADFQQSNVLTGVDTYSTYTVPTVTDYTRSIAIGAGYRRGQVAIKLTVKDGSNAPTPDMAFIIFFDTNSAHAISMCSTTVNNAWGPNVYAGYGNTELGPNFFNGWISQCYISGSNLVIIWHNGSANSQVITNWTAAWGVWT